MPICSRCKSIVIPCDGGAVVTIAAGGRTRAEATRLREVARRESWKRSVTGAAELAMAET